MNSRGATSLVVHQASAEGVGGIAVVELFGERSRDILQRHFKARRTGTLPASGTVRFGVFNDSHGAPVDDVIVSVVEPDDSWCRLGGWSVSCHGGPVVTERVIEVLVQAGARRASTEELLEDPTVSERLDRLARQAFRLFLNAQTTRAAGYFFEQSEGAFKMRLGGLLERAESGDPDGAIAELEEAIALAPQAIRLGSPLRVLAAGHANVGKSTLFNALFGQERVVVSTLAGTTRDLIQETIEIAGYPVVLIDSAGLRPVGVGDAVERAGIERAHGARDDTVLFLRDEPGPRSAEEAAFLDGLPPSRYLEVLSKSDLRPDGGIPSADTSTGPSAGPIEISSLTGAGLDRLREAIRQRWLGPLEGSPIPPLPFTEEILGRARELLGRLLHTGLDGFRAAFIEYFPEIDVAP